jgi:hypothetical protein
MATRTFHISFPTEWAEQIEREMKEGHYTPSEYFKQLYRQKREEQLSKDIAESEDDYRNGRMSTAKSLMEMMERNKQKIKD